MRTLIGLVLLLMLCGLAGYLQDRWSDEVRAERESLRSIPTDLHGREQSWGDLKIGRPSGADPIELPERVPEPEIASPVEAELPFLKETGLLEAPEVYRRADFEYVVPQGRVLSKICEDFYSSGRAPIPDRVAAYNGLKSPDSLKAGFLLRLPPW